MSLSPGHRLGTYEVISPLGAGGMGEVYRARDTRLNRTVAIKALPAAVLADAERVARFEREAQILAALKHPGIAGIYGVEEQEGARYLILEFVEGEDLAAVLGRARATSTGLDVADALNIARQVADALEAAHEKGIIHRDLKPANVMLEPDGAVKVLDFGLGKALGSEGSSGTSDPTNSPTLTAATQIGVIFGTAAYMSPEQAKGRPADKRSDVWAFGCVLFELLSGARPFAGEDVSDTLAAVLRGEPDWSRLPATTPAPIVRLLKRCLAKDRRQRLPDLSVARFEIEDCLSGQGSGQTPGADASAPGHVRPTPRGRTGVIAGVAALAGAAAAAAVIYSIWPAPPRPATPARFRVDPPESVALRSRTAGPGIDLAIAPDGSKLVYWVSVAPGRDTLYVREMGQVESAPIPGVAGAINAFAISPDGDRLAFHSGAKLHALTFGATAPTVVADAPATPTGIAWLSNDALIYPNADGVFYRVSSAGGGTPEVLFKPQTRSDSDTIVRYGFPEVVPGGDVLLYSVLDGVTRRIEARRISGGEPVIVVDNASFPKVTAAGELLFVRDGRLMAARFDLSTLTMAGQPAALDEDIGPAKSRGGSSFDISDRGTFVSLVAADATKRRFVWLSREGKVLGHVGAEPMDMPRYPRLSHDNRRLAATVGGNSAGQIWIFDLTGSEQPVKLTFEGHNTFPMWTLDDRHLVFLNNQPELGGRQIYRLPTDGSTLKAELSHVIPGTAVADLSPDGTSLLFNPQVSSSPADLSLVSIASKDPPAPWLNERFSEALAAFSPDGKWVAYVSDQTERSEIWVRPFPGPGAPTRLSADGGTEPRWSRDQREIYFQNEGKMMVVPVTVTPASVKPGPPRMLFEGGFIRSAAAVPRTYDVSREGRFLMLEAPGAGTVAERGTLTVIVGFDSTIRTKLR